MIDFNKLIKTTNESFEQRVKDTIVGYADKALADKGIPTFSQLKNIHKEAYNNVLNNANWEGNLNDYFNLDITDTINNSLLLGLNASKSNGNSNSPNATKIGETEGANVGMKKLAYPLIGNDPDEKAPHMTIRGFKYQYDTNDVLGNMVNLEKGPKVEATAFIQLPLPGNLASGLSQQFEDYSSVFAKLAKANNYNDGDSTSFLDQLQSLTASGTENMTKELTSIASMAAIFGIASGAGIGGAAASSLDESLKYIRVNAGFTVNPMQQTSYVGSNMRVHSFEFNMVPKNKREAIQCKKIIETLQYCSIGEKRTEIGGILINFPSVWNIRFHNHNGENINGMLMIPDCFLSDVNVTYSPSRAGFTVTRDNDPFAYVLNLTFKECQNLVRDDLSYIRQGGSLLKDIHKPTPQGKFNNSSIDIVGKSVPANNNDSNSAPVPPFVKVDPEKSPKPKTELKSKPSFEIKSGGGSMGPMDKPGANNPWINKTGELHKNKLEALSGKRDADPDLTPKTEIRTPTLGGM